MNKFEKDNLNSIHALSEVIRNAVNASDCNSDSGDVTISFGLSNDILHLCDLLHKSWVSGHLQYFDF